MKRRIYLTLERGRDVALRNLLRRVFLVGGYEEATDANGTTVQVRRTRIPIVEFVAALSMGCNEVMENDEVECLMANMIYKVSISIFISIPRSFHTIFWNVEYTTAMQTGNHSLTRLCSLPPHL